MKFILIGAIFFISCNSSCTRSLSNSEIKERYQAWDSCTLTALDQIEKTKSEFSAKASFLKILLRRNQSNPSGIDPLNRVNFAHVFDSVINAIKWHNDIVVIELKESGEKILNKKAIIYPFEMVYCSFVENENNDWVILRKGKITKEEINKIVHLESVDSQDASFLWGYDVNDILLITTFDTERINVKPVFLVELNIFNAIKEAILSP